MDDTRACAHQSWIRGSVHECSRMLVGYSHAARHTSNTISHVLSSSLFVMEEDVTTTTSLQSQSLYPEGHWQE